MVEQRISAKERIGRALFIAGGLTAVGLGVVAIPIEQASRDMETDQQFPQTISNAEFRAAQQEVITFEGAVRNRVRLGYDIGGVLDIMSPDGVRQAYDTVDSYAQWRDQSAAFRTARRDSAMVKEVLEAAGLWLPGVILITYGITGFPSVSERRFRNRIITS